MGRKAFGLGIYNTVLVGISTTALFRTTEVKKIFIMKYTSKITYVCEKTPQPSASIFRLDKVSINYQQLITKS